VRVLRAAAWAVLLLDLVVLGQLAFGLLTQPSSSGADPALRGLTVMLGSGLLATLFLLVVSSWLRSMAGLWVSLGCAAVPLLWTVDAIVENLWQ
jgi:hypothetical protein